MMLKKIISVGMILLSSLFTKTSYAKTGKSLGEYLQVCLPEIAGGGNLIEFAREKEKLTSLDFKVDQISSTCQDVLNPLVLKNSSDWKECTIYGTTERKQIVCQRSLPRSVIQLFTAKNLLASLKNSCAQKAMSQSQITFAEINPQHPLCTYRFEDLMGILRSRSSLQKPWSDFKELVEQKCQLSPQGTNEVVLACKQIPSVLMKAFQTK